MSTSLHKAAIESGAELAPAHEIFGRLTKPEAQAVAGSLLHCPFCGVKPVVTIRGNGDMAVNPKARCATEGCIGSKLSVISLDVPSNVAAWNTRALS